MFAAELLDERTVFHHGHFQRIRRWREGVRGSNGSFADSWIVWDAVDEGVKDPTTEWKNASRGALARQAN